MKYRKLVIGLAVLSLLLMLFAGCSSSNSEATNSNDSGGSSSSANGNEIKIGVVLPLTGNDAQHGENSRRGIELAAEMINEAGGIESMEGAKISLEVRDATSDPTKSASAMQELLSSGEKPLGIIGVYASSLTMAAAPIAEKEQIPLLTTSFTDDLVNQGYKYIFRIAPGASDVGAAQLNYSLEIAENQNKEIDNVAIVYMNNAYGSSQAEGLREAAEGAGLNISLFEAYSEQLTDAAPLVTKIKNSHPDLLFPVSYFNDGVLLMRALSGSGIPVVGGVGGFITPDFEKNLGEDVNGVFSVNTSSPDAYGEIGDRYEEAYGTFMPQDAHDNAAALFTIAHALELNPTTDPETLADTLHNEKFDLGAAGSMPGGYVEFDERGANTVAKPLMVQWQDQNLVSVWPEEEAHGEPEWPDQE